MKRLVGFLITFGLLLLLSLPLMAAAQSEPAPQPIGLRPDAPTYAQHGPYWVGTREFVIPDPQGKRPLPLTVWYPALNPQGVAETVTYTYDPGPSLNSFTLEGHAIEQAAPDTTKGPYPLVIFSHGNVGFRYFSMYLTEHLASYGFVVLAVDHVGNTIGYSDDPLLAGEDGSGFIESSAMAITYRPGDVQREIDYAATLTASDSPLAGLIDLEHIGVVGYSYGGYTALASAGGQIDFTPLQTWCNQNANDEVVTSSLEYGLQCFALAPAEETIKTALGVNVGPEELWPAFDVKGVDAIVPLAPWAIFFTSGGAKPITVPTLMMAGSGDTLLPIDRNAAAIYPELSSQNKILALFDDADHGIFANKSDAYLLAHDWYEFTSDRVWDMDRAHDLINHFTTAFLLDVLKGDKDAAAVLAPDQVSFPGITYQAQGF